MNRLYHIGAGLQGENFNKSKTFGRGVVMKVSDRAALASWRHELLDGEPLIVPYTIHSHVPETPQKPHLEKEWRGSHKVGKQRPSK